MKLVRGVFSISGMMRMGEFANISERKMIYLVGRYIIYQNKYPIKCESEYIPTRKTDVKSIHPSTHQINILIRILPTGRLPK